MIHVMGHHVAFELRDGQEVILPVGYGLFYDADAEDMPRCVVVAGAYRQTGRPMEVTRNVEKFFGEEYTARAGKTSVDLGALARRQGGWRELGDVAKVFYIRGGKRAPGPYHHDFKDRQFWVFSAKTTLEQSGRWYRLTLPGTCVINDRGFVAP